MYVELRWIIAGVGHAAPRRDDHRLGASALSLESLGDARACAGTCRSLSEVLHLAYASYYLLVYLPPIALYVRGKRDAFVKTMLALTIVYGVCFITYALFPVDGPRYLVGPAAAPDGPVRRFVLALLERGSSRGTAFPSSHVAASLVAALCALRYQRRVGLVVAPVRRRARARDGVRRIPLRRGRARRRDPRRPRLARVASLSGERRRRAARRRRRRPDSGRRLRASASGSAMLGSSATRSPAGCQPSRCALEPGDAAADRLELRLAAAPEAEEAPRTGRRRSRSRARAPRDPTGRTRDRPRAPTARSPARARRPRRRRRAA